MIHGIIISAWGILCLYTAFFTNNKYCFVWVPAHIMHAWGKGVNEKDNKYLNITGGIIFLIVGLLML